ncbi:MAG TPA: NAD(P)/FAD-dependent oxidoreductase [Saprospiraceae bacterium]|nr:NAD(P)/FAD-dependent oxidoreductase [Saprospiraceae bacterium]
MSTHQITVVGAGPCGTLLAIRLAQRGYEVRLYEKLPDMRTTEVPAGRSINLALSDRGIKALKMIGLDKAVEREVIPMYSRMIHDESGGEPYLLRYSGRPHEFINSVSRPGLNTQLLHEAARYPNLSVYFEQNCTSVDLRHATCRFIDTKGITTVVASEVVFGTDGAGSVVRRSMFDQSAVLRFDYAQDFLDHGYKELTIPANEIGGWRLEKHALHIWPRQKFMLIALPNLDGSFTVTLFLPFDAHPGFNQLKDTDRVSEFFRTTFPSAFEHMDTLDHDFMTNPTGILGTIKCYPWHANGKVLLLGDAAHAIVPFYGQGMNCALEDVVVLDDIIDQYDGNWEKIFNTYQATRKKDTDAIADLAVDNYYEMRDHVDNPEFILKRKIEMLLEEKYPSYSSKYNLVAFNEDVPYSEAMRRGRAQDEFLLEYCKGKMIEEVDLEEVVGRLKMNK